MIKYFIRHYWRYLAMALAFATITFLINSCEVKAETNYNQSIVINYSETSTNVDRILYNDTNHTNKAFANAGRGYLIGIISSYRYITNATFEIPTVYSINARTDFGYSTCEVSSLANNMSDDTQMKANLYGFKCDLTMSTNGLISLSVNFKPSVTNSWTVESYRLTFNNNLQAQEVSYTQYLYDYMQNYVYPRLNGIENNTGATATELRWVYEYLQNYIYIMIQNNNTQLQNINDKLNQMMEQNQVCNYIDKGNISKEHAYLKTDGTIFENQNTAYGITDYIKITNNSKIKVVNTTTNAASQYTCFYNINKEKISCIAAENLSGNLTIPNNTSYVRFSINSNTNKPTFEICDNGNQVISNNQEQINNNITDSSVSDPDNDLSDMEDQVASNSVISDLLLLPINMFQNIVNAIGGTCSSFSLGALFGTNLVLPCINIESLIGSGLWTTIDILFCGIFVLSIRKKFVDIFENITSLKDRGNELE